MTGALRIPGWRLNENDIDCLAGLKTEADGLFKMKRHRGFRDFFASLECYFVSAHLVIPVNRVAGAGPAACPTAGFDRTMRAKAEWLWIDSKFSASTT